MLSIANPQNRRSCNLCVFTLLFGLFLSLNGFAQFKVTLQGYTVDKKTGQPIPYATVKIRENKQNIYEVPCDSAGFYEFSANEKGERILQPGHVYEIVADHRDYTFLAQEVSTKDVKANKTIMATFMMNRMDNENTTLHAKLLYGKEYKKPLTNHPVILKSASNAKLEETVTDEFGDFRFEHVNKSEKLTIEVGKGSKDIQGTVFLARPDGIVVGHFNATGNLFTFDVLPAMHSQLNLKYAEDTNIKLDDIEIGGKGTVSATERIDFDPNRADLNQAAKERLSKIVSVMMTNPKVKVEIGAHTDSRGEGHENKSLSEKRAEVVKNFLIASGVAQQRIKAVGYGEEKLLNYCQDGVNCSEKEHSLNRRVEFRFSY